MVCGSSDCANQIYCSNWPHDRFNGNHYCHFTYDDASMNNLYMRATSGPALNIDWTVKIEFFDRKSWTPPPRQFKRSIHESPEAEIAVRSDITTLMQTVTPTAQTATTLNLKGFYFRFCPDQQTGKRYDITVTVMSTDSKSTMFTYVRLCRPNQRPCRVTPSTATHLDIRPVGINIVTLTSDVNQPEEVHVAVIGWGDGEHTNSFVLGATVTRRA
ncbi:hypothetical protein QZH41_013459 [Actinostola sp. cb2023]|nr:hypothetical protein QZH41_013459 [Actinostola sp. cb2023]